MLARVAEGGIDYLVVTSPNNPTGQLASETFILRLLDATDALVMVDEAYFEFSRQTMRPYLAQHKNLVILRTFSKRSAWPGRVWLHPGRRRGRARVRQGAPAVFGGRRLAGRCARGVREPREVRARHPGRHRGARPPDRGTEEDSRREAFPSDANYVLFRVENAPVIWEALYERGVLVRDFSRAAHLENCLRVTVGASEENDAFLRALRDAVMGKCDLKVRRPDGRRNEPTAATRS